MKIYIHNIFKPFLVLALSALAFASCMQQVDEEMVSATGYLSAPALDVDVTVEDLMGTKAVEGFTVDQPNVADFRYVVKDKDGAVKYDATGLWESLMLPVGKYSVEAFHGTNGFGAPYFYGKTPSDAVIAAGRQNTPNLTAQVNNAVVRVRVDSDFAKHFTLSSVELTSDGVTKTLTAVEIADWYFVPSGAELTIKLIGESNAGVYKEFTHVITPSAKSANDIVCRQDGNNMPSITLPDQSAGAWATRLYITPATFTNISAANQAKLVYEVIPEGGDWASAKAAEQIEGQYYVVKDLSNGSRYTVRARIGNLTAEQTVEVKENIPGTTVALVHDNNDDPNVMLSGTNATLNLNLSGVLATLNSKGLLQLSTSLKKSGALVRSSSVAAGVMTGETSSWPYLPQGNDYALTVSHKLSTETDYIPSSEIGGFVSKPPVFGITLGKSYTSYDYGVGNADNGFSKNTDKANKECKPESLYDAGVSWNISSTLMSSDLYKTGRFVNVFLTQGGTPKTTYTPTSFSTSTSYAVGEITDLEWKQYEVSAEVSFDNVKNTTETRTHHITGLPYNATPPKDTGTYYWTKTGGTTAVKFLDNRASLSTSTGKPSIYSPAFNIPVAVSVGVKVTSVAVIYGNWSYKNTYLVNIGSTNVVNQPMYGNKDTSQHTVSGTGTFTSENNKVECKQDYGWAAAYIDIYSVKIEYN